EGKLRKLRGVTDVLTTIGDTTGKVRAGEGDVTSGSIYLRLTDLRDRDFTQFDVMADARALLAKYPELRVSVQGVNAFRGGGTRQSELEFDLTGPSLEKLIAFSDQMTERMKAEPGFVDVDTSLSVRKPELRAVIDRARAAELGISVEDIAETLGLFVGGEPVSKYKEEDEQYDVWLRAVKAQRNDPAEVYALTVWSPKAQLVKLYSLLQLEEAKGPAQIDRQSRQRKVGMYANLDGIPLGTAVQRVEAIAKDMKMPPAYKVQFSGRAKVLAETVQSFFTAFLLSLL